jgi:ribosomal protein S18 acetylase RimI-like enzyme
MPRLTDPVAIRAILNTDRPWAVYALGDLSPRLMPHCTWLCPPGDAPALALLYRGFSTPVLLTLGTPAALAPLLDEIAAVQRFYLHVRPEIIPLLQTRYRTEGLKHMWRMVLERGRFRDVPAPDVERLGPADVDAVCRLYQDGAASGEMPDFFDATMVSNGVFCGVREGKELIAVAGTHLVAEGEGVAAVGNVYTRRDQRRRGLAGRVTAAVVRELRSCGIELIALNVAQSNPTAEKVYERLGFARYTAFCEGLAVRSPG